MSERVLDVLRAYHIDDWQSETFYQHQNFAEGMIGQIKNLVNRIMNNSGAKPNEWLLVLKYVVLIWNRMARKSYVAARIAAEQIIDLRNTLRYLGVPIAQSVVFGDSASVVNSSMQPHGKLTKRHMALSFQRVRECVAAKIFSYLYIPSSENPADMLSKHWGHNQVWETLFELYSSSSS
jgi:hypothetical protein